LSWDAALRVRLVNRNRKLIAATDDASSSRVESGGVSPIDSAGIAEGSADGGDVAVDAAESGGITVVTEESRAESRGTAVEASESGGITAEAESGGTLHINALDINGGNVIVEAAIQKSRDAAR